MRPQFPTPCLCLVTDRKACRKVPLEEAVGQAVVGGVNMVQLREKELSGRPLLELAYRLQEVTARAALLVVNERADVALACGADGVQLGEEALSVEAARRIAGPDLLIGRSVHSVEGALAAEAQGTDFLVVGTVFPTRYHSSNTAVGLGLLSRVAEKVHIPFVGIGGINSSNVNEVMEMGAWGAAVISAILSSGAPRKAAEEIKGAVEEAWVKSKLAGERLA